MKDWLTFLKKGLSRKPTEDRFAALRPHPRGGVRRNLENLRPILGRHWRKAAFGVVLILVASLFGLPQPLITRMIVDKVILGHQLGLLALAIGLYAAVSIIERLSRTLYEFHFTRFEQEVILDIQESLFKRTLRLPKAFFDESQTGYLMSRLSLDVQNLHFFFSEALIYFFVNLLRLIGGVGLLLYLSWTLTLAVLIVLPGLVLAVSFFSSKIRLLSHESMEQQARVSSYFQESLSAVPLIKAFAREDMVVGRLMTGLRGAFQVALETSTVSSVAGLAIQSVPGIARVAVMAWGAYWVVQGHWTLGSLLAYQAYLGYVFGPAQAIAGGNSELQTALAALDRVSALYDIAPEDENEGGIVAERLHGEVELRGVTFGYAEERPVLQDISFRVLPGEHVVIVGPSGVGKTTLLSLILGFYRPTMGEVLFDGRASSEYQPRSLRERIGYVSQSTQLLSDTIMVNLRLGNGEADEEAVYRAAKVAGIHELIVSLPDGYHTQVGENGVRLSEGQKQRISIARALIKDHDILVLDEPTAAVDNPTERSIFESLPSLLRSKTLFVVAHRLPTIRNSDRVLLLSESRLVAVGTHESLLETSEYYRSVIDPGSFEAVR